MSPRLNSKAMNVALRPPIDRGGFTLIEILVSSSIMALLLFLLANIADSSSKAWRQAKKRTESFQNARSCLELVGRELIPAVVDTRTQMVVGPATLITDRNARQVAPTAPVALWVAPLGTQGELRTVGYYLYRDEARLFYRLKRIFIAPTDEKGKENSYFPKMINPDDLGDATLRTSPVNADWFTRNWDEYTFDEEDPKNDKVVVSTVADGVVALWIQCLDHLGNPIPQLSRSKTHPASELYFNSAAFSQSATSTPFDNEESFIYLAETPQSLKANRVPATMVLAVVTVDQTVLENGLVPPQQQQLYTSTGALDLEASIKNYETLLEAANIRTAHTFVSRIQLANGK